MAIPFPGWVRMSRCKTYSRTILVHTVHGAIKVQPRITHAERSWPFTKGA